MTNVEYQTRPEVDAQERKDAMELFLQLCDLEDDELLRAVEDLNLGDHEE